MKQSINWHLECLAHYQSSVKRQMLAVDRAKAELERMRIELEKYEKQVLKAQSMGKDGFDSERFKV